MAPPGRTLSVLAAVIALVATGSVVAADQLRPAGAAITAPPVSVAVPPGPMTMACPADLRLPTEADGSSDLAYDPQFDPTPAQTSSSERAVTLTNGQAELSWYGLGHSSSATTGAGEGFATMTQAVPKEPTIVTAQPAGTRPALASAAVGMVTTSGDLRGLAAATCQVPATDLYLIGGGTDTGSSARLTIANPGQTAVSVDLTIWSGTGLEHTVGTNDLIIPAGSQRAILLEGVVVQAKRLAVWVHASGGVVSAYLQDSRLDGLIPRGVDLISSSVQPATSTQIPAISVTDSTLESSEASLIRVVVPGEKAATGDVRLWGPGGEVDLPGLSDVALPAGTVTDLSLAGLPAGTYTAAVSANQPIVASAMVVRTGANQPTDRAWAASGKPASSGMFALPGLASPTLTLGSDRAAMVEVTPIGADGTRGQTRQVALDGGHTAEVSASQLAVDAKPPVAVEFDASSAVTAGIVLSQQESDGTLISVLTPVADPPAHEAVKVIPPR